MPPNNARANNGGEKRGAEDDGPAYKELPFGIGSELQASLADKIGGERMAGIGRNLMGFGQNMLGGGW